MAALKGAIIQRDRKTYAVVTRSPAGIVTPEHLEKVASIVARKYRVPTVKITGGIACSPCSGLLNMMQQMSEENWAPTQSRRKSPA